MTPRSRSPTAAEPDIWEELTSGQLDKELRAALKVLAEQRDDLARKLAAYTPLEEAFRARVTHVVAEQLTRGKQRRRFLRLGLPTLVMSMAAAALLFVARPANDVPPYDLLLTGSVAETRGQSQAPGELVRVTPQSELELVLRPAQRVHGDVMPTHRVDVGVTPDGLRDVWTSTGAHAVSDRSMSTSRS